MFKTQKTPVFLALIIVFLGLLTSCNPEENYPAGVTFQKTDHHFISIDWSPDSKRLVGTTMPNSGTGINIGFPGSEVYIWEPGSDIFEQVSDEEETWWNEDAVWRPQEEEILYYSQSEFGEEYRFGTVDLTTKEIVPVMKHGQFAAWFPDGHRIAISSSGISIFDVKTNRHETIWTPRRGQLVHNLAVSPDGNSLAVITHEVGQSIHRIFIMDADGESETLIFEQQGYLDKVDWSPDGRWLTFKDSTKEQDIVAMRLEDNCLTKPLGIKSITQTYVSVSDIKWSPDGSTIAIVGNKNRQRGIFYIETTSDLVKNWLATADC